MLSESAKAWSIVVLATLYRCSPRRGDFLQDGPAINLVRPPSWVRGRSNATADYAMKAVARKPVSTAWVDGDEEFEKRT